MTVTEAAEYLGLSRSTVYELCTAKLIRHRRAGARRGRIDITREWCDEYLKAGEIEPVGDTLVQPASPSPPQPQRRESITMTAAERERLSRRRQKSCGAA